MSLTSNFRSALRNLDGGILYAQGRSIRKRCMPHTAWRDIPRICSRRTRIGPWRSEINRLGYEPGRLSLYFCVARKDAPVDVYARSRGLFAGLPDTNKNPKISGVR